MLENINFLFFLFFFNFLFLIQNNFNAINLFFYAESLWCIIYLLFLVIGLNIDDINALSLSFFVLAFAAVEYALGFVLLISFKEFKSSYEFKNKELTNSCVINKENFSNLNSFFWTK